MRLTLPGTHNKWTLVENGSITNFLTAFTGELFSLLRNNSILVPEQNTINFNQDVFLSGVKAIDALGDAQLLHALFATRSKQVLGEMASTDALSYLSGLIIGADVIRQCYHHWRTNIKSTLHLGTKSFWYC